MEAAHTTAGGGATADTGGRCCACGFPVLDPHLAVAGEVGPDGLIPTTSEFGTALADIVRCRACGHMQLERMPSDEELGRLYAAAESSDYVEEEAGQRETARRVLERIERHAGPGPILDVGCWVGFLLAEARERGWEPLGLEPSEWAASYARNRLGLPVQPTDLFAAELEDEHFDAVFLGDVIEHLTDPSAALERVRGVLRPGGVVAMALPDAGSLLAKAMGRRWWAVVPTHVQYFTRDSMERLLVRSGFEPLLAETQPKAFTVRYYLERLESFVGGGPLVSTAERVGLADRMWAPDFGDRMLVVARRER